MFNDRKLTGTGHGFVKAYSNNWLSQLGAVYRYESPKDVLRKPNHQHRKIALYSILAMAFVAFFTLFMIVHEAERKSRNQILIESSFTNETAIEPSAGGYNTVLTTPLSSGIPANETKPMNDGEVEEGSSMKRTRRLRYYGVEQKPTVRPAELVGRDRLVLLPARFLKPPLRAPEWTSWEEAKESNSTQAADEAERRRDVLNVEPKPFQVAPLNGQTVPIGFQQPRVNRTPKALAPNDWTPSNVQDIVRQLTLAKRKQQQQLQQQHLLYYNYPYAPQALQPAEFNHPVHPNHRVKFSGIYRHPRKEGDITTLFGAASQKPREVHLQAPQLINQQLQPDRLYNFKPSNPSEVNLLATEQFRFAPASQPTPSDSEEWPTRGMPFSVMLNLEPMPVVGLGTKGFTQQQRYHQRKRIRNPYRNPYRQPAWPEQTFAQLTPYQQQQQQRVRPSTAQPYRAVPFGQAAYDSDEYEGGENYFRKEGRVPPRIPPFSAPFIAPGRLMVHFNIYPRHQAVSQVANRKSSHDYSTTPATLESLELNRGEERQQPQPVAQQPPSEVAPPTLAPVTSTVEVIKSIEIPTQINFDHVPLGRNPPPPLPSFSRWTSDEWSGSGRWTGGVRA
ncbi:AGAP006465-PA [Anopheles gambiae str. PEST]|uniref:AGAP006465-PA n=1 Tax=Anopheles gambiae TaxID=7165 RepID=A7UUA7_ANOGA|nr:AGAP006465-PA [Anopheles gambiae str. PEST]